MSSPINQPGSDPVDPAVCPLCGGSNACQMASANKAGAAGQSDCWCRSAHFPAELLAQVPPAAVDKACICAACQQAAQAQQQ